MLSWGTRSNVSIPSDCIEQRVVAKCLSLSHSIMYDSDSSELESVRLKIYHFFQHCALVK